MPNNREDLLNPDDYTCLHCVPLENFRYVSIEEQTLLDTYMV